MGIFRSFARRLTPRWGGAILAGSEDNVTSIDVRSLLKTEKLDTVRKIVADCIVAQLARVMHTREENVSRVRVLGEDRP